MKSSLSLCSLSLRSMEAPSTTMLTSSLHTQMIPCLPSALQQAHKKPRRRCRKRKHKRRFSSSNRLCLWGLISPSNRMNTFPRLTVTKMISQHSWVLLLSLCSSSKLINHLYLKTTSLHRMLLSVYPCTVNRPLKTTVPTLPLSRRMRSMTMTWTTRSLPE